MQAPVLTGRHHLVAGRPVRPGGPTLEEIMGRGSRWLVASLVAGTSALAGARADAQAVGGQRDDFEGLTTMGWHVGDPAHPAPPTVIATGGPAGADDGYLRLTSIGGDGPGSRLSAINTTRWAGDYPGAGIYGIGMDVRNFGQSDVVLRLLFATFPDAPGPPDNLAWSTAGVLVGANSGWTRIFFPITPGALFVPVGTYAGALSGAEELRIFHNPAPVFMGPPNSSPAIAAVIGIDNVTAAVVPEPSALALLATGAVGLLAMRRRGTRAR